MRYWVLIVDYVSRNNSSCVVYSQIAMESFYFWDRHQYRSTLPERVRQPVTNDWPLRYRIGFSGLKNCTTYALLIYAAAGLGLLAPSGQPLLIDDFFAGGLSTTKSFNMTYRGWPLSEC